MSGGELDRLTEIVTDAREAGCSSKEIVFLVLTAVRVPQHSAPNLYQGMCLDCDEYSFPDRTVTAYTDHILADAPSERVGA